MCSFNGAPLASSSRNTFSMRKPQFAWSEDGQHIVVCGDSAYAFVWDAYTLVCGTVSVMCGIRLFPRCYCYVHGFHCDWSFVAVAALL